MADWDEKDIMAFAARKSGEKSERAIEGPAMLGSFTVWRAWTYDGNEYHAHYVIAEDGREELIFKRISSHSRTGSLVLLTLATLTAGSSTGSAAEWRQLSSLLCLDWFCGR